MVKNKAKAKTVYKVVPKATGRGGKATVVGDNHPKIPLTKRAIEPLPIFTNHVFALTARRRLGNQYETIGKPY